MSKSPILIACVAIAALTSFPLCAQLLPKRQPGLWEIQVSGGGSRGPNMDERLAKLNPAQRALMEERLKQLGMSISPGNTMTMRHCLTPQEAEAEAGKTILSKFQRNMERDSRCEEKVLARTSTEVRFHAVCHTDQGVSEFEGRIYDISPTSVAMEMDGKSPARGAVHYRQRSRWLGADCGNQK